jgi:methylated-DNA-[protein]-cysteine S-methyltransferase
VTPAGYRLFDTAIGACAIAWSDRGICGLQLPEASPDATHARMRRRFRAVEQPFSPHAAHAVDAIRAMLDGAADDLTAIALDMREVPPFNQRVYALARRIPPGRTSTYGDIAARLGSRGLSRAVGQALGRNPFAIIVPCHRVVSADGALRGFSAHGGLALKQKLLELERAKDLRAQLPFG